MLVLKHAWHWIIWILLLVTSLTNYHIVGIRRTHSIIYFAHAVIGCFFQGGRAIYLHRAVIACWSIAASVEFSLARSHARVREWAYARAYTWYWYNCECNIKNNRCNISRLILVLAHTWHDGTKMTLALLVPQFSLINLSLVLALLNVLMSLVKSILDLMKFPKIPPSC